MSYRQSPYENTHSGPDYSSLYVGLPYPLVGFTPASHYSLTEE